ncbi:hypothetical protein FE257_003965 [Aspergillus nanangensis]|uniref:Uncharacterized protein n=1 Tax=Aspergillus nanangensis TaxID=2582783 RepID=A0AAD4CTH6_ASPNN|nr:hypothetical protein FE257_003965 [Aspergillus nanangensis]
MQGFVASIAAHIAAHMLERVDEDYRRSYARRVPKPLQSSPSMRIPLTWSRRVEDYTITIVIPRSS